MLTYLQPPQPSLGLDRIANALRRYVPAGCAETSDASAAELTIIYAIGRRDHVQRQVAEIASRGGEYAMIQVCLKSTMNPDAWEWMQVWETAKTVWSYYDLDQALNESNSDPSLRYHMPCDFLHAPLGVDARVFYPREQSRVYVVATSGVSRLQESVRECELATELVDRRMLHLGPKVTGKGWVDCKSGLSDDKLAQYYSACEFVSGLRRTEGFELPAAEGLLSGCRPLLFDTPDYRFNYKEWGVYLHEGTRQEVVDQLVQLFKQGARPVTTDEREEAAHWFNWERVCGEFWQRCLA